MSNKNLLQETKEFIKKLELTPADIIYIGSSTHSCTWKEFCKLANKNYYSGYGGQEVASDLEIAFKNGVVMRRGEYDGSEWWEATRPFVVPQTTLPITNLFNAWGYVE